MASKMKNVQIALGQYLQIDRGRLYLPAGNVEAAMDAIADSVPGISAGVKDCGGGLCKLIVHSLGTKTMHKLLEYPIR